MKGVQAWNYSAFHQRCSATGYVDVVDFAGFKYVRCSKCQVLCNLDAIGVKYEDYGSACKEVIYDGEPSADNG